MHDMLHWLTSSSKSLISTSPVPVGRLVEVDGHSDTIGLSTELFKYGKMVSASIYNYAPVLIIINIIISSNIEANVIIINVFAASLSLRHIIYRGRLGLYFNTKKLWIKETIMIID